MAFTVRIPQSYATRIIDAIRNSGSNPRIQDAKIRGLNVQPDGSLLVRSESAESPYEAYVDIFNQNLGIPFAAIRGFETLADTAADANQYRTGIATTPEKKAAIDASGLYGDSRAIAPEDIATPFTGAGDVQDITFDERRAIGEMPFGPYQITPAQLLTPSFYRDQQAAAQLGEGQGEGTSIAGGLFRDSKVKPTSVGYVPPDPFAPQTDAVPKIVGDTGDEPVDMPANLPPFWQERYDEYLNLSPYLQSVIIRDQVKDFIALQPYRGIAVEQDDGVSGAAGADVGLEELQKILGQTTGATVNPDGSISFVPGTVDPSTIDVTRRIPDPLQLQGYANTGLQDILNIFYANPDRYISEIPLFEDVYDPVSGQVTGQRQVGTQQVLSPVAQAALQAFSTQRGAESANIASRFGTATPFGAIAGLGGTAEQALGLAELQARAGVTNPFAALGTGSGIGDISQILRGGLTVQEQLALEGLQARGGLTAQERLAEQRLAALSPLLQASPGTLGGLSRVLGGEEQLRSLFSPFTSYAAQPVTGQGAPIQVSQQPFAPSPRTGEFIDPRQFGPVRVGPFDTQAPRQPMVERVGDFDRQAPRQTVGGYQRAGLFDRGGIEAEAGMTGEELGRYLGQVTPFGGGSPRGSLGAQLV
jgi:hypothetical protein